MEQRRTRKHRTSVRGPSLEVINRLQEIPVLKHSGRGQGQYEAFPVARDGKVQIPEGPGWGVEISSSWLEKSACQVSEVSAL